MTASSNSPLVVTVGAGASPLVADLLRLGYRVVAVDIADAALATLVGRLDQDTAVLATERLALVAADVRALRLDEPVDVWHDRAVFHFLVDADDRAAYAASAADAVRPGGHLVIATFAPSGPASCSGLPVQRHDAASLAAAFAPHFELQECFEQDHVTPWSAEQRFTHAVLLRT